MADTTWLCSAAMEKESDKRTAFKFEVKGGELFGQTYIQHIERILGPKLKKFGWPTEKNVIAASYKIVEDTDERLLAVYAYPFSPGSPDTMMDFVVINKKTGWMHQGIVTMRPSDDVGFNGECHSGR
jgi:hypothetical protein